MRGRRQRKEWRLCSLVSSGLGRRQRKKWRLCSLVSSLLLGAMATEAERFSSVMEAERFGSHKVHRKVHRSGSLIRPRFFFCVPSYSKKPFSFKKVSIRYVGVDESNDVQLFYYFVKSERNPEEDPLVFWLTGGPRCSSFSAFAFEIGPVNFKIEEYNGSLPTLILNPNSWTKVANIVFLDQPVGSGFSYSRTEQGLHITDTKSAMDTLTVITKWLINHPEFLSNPLYICGDSYAGRIIPFLVQEIIKGIEVGKMPLINFAGYLLGNAVTDAHFEQNAKIPFAHGKGFISDELYESLKQTCKGDYTNFGPKTVECSKDLDEFTKLVSGINGNQVLEPLCSIGPIATEQATIRRWPSHSNQIKDINPLLCREYGYLLSYYWANSAIVREALHIRKGTVKEWIRCNYLLPYQGDIESSIEYHRNLSTKGYRSLIYSGDHDMGITYISTEAWIRLLNLSIIDDWHPWLVDGQVAGYTRKFSSGMTYATVKGGGHIAPEYKPKECFAMFKRWVSHNPL